MRGQGMYEVLSCTTVDGAAFSVSIVLPVYNAASDALRSRLNELVTNAGPDTELIVVDDASHDKTRQQILTHLRGARNVTVLGAVENGGVAAARNAAVTRATGDYVWFVDWDDEWFPHSVSQLLKTARANDADVVVCQADVIEGDRTRRIDGLDEAATLTGPQAFELMLAGQIGGYLWSKLIRRTLLGADPFPLLSYQSDLGGVAPMLARASRVICHPEVLYRHVGRAGSVSRSSTTDVTCKIECRDILTRIVDDMPESDRRERLLRRFIFRRVYLGAVNTAVRLANDASDAHDIIRRVRSEFSWTNLAQHMRTDARTALRLALVKAIGPQYARLSNVVRRLVYNGRNVSAIGPVEPGRTRVMHVAPPKDDTTSYADLITVDAAAVGLSHRAFSWKHAIRLDFDVLHIHWPERMIRGRTPFHRVGKRCATRVLLARMKRRRVPIVRTLHNIRPHERGPRGEEALLRAIDKATTTFVALNRWTPVPDPRAAQAIVIPHPHYRGFHPLDPGASPVPGRLLYFGLIRDYKGVDALLDAFSALGDDGISLRIVGSGTQRWREVIEEAVVADPRITARLEYVSDADLTEEIRQAQAVVFPYQKMHNSGATFAALGQGRRVLVPDNEVNADLAAEVGDDWILTFNGTIDADDLRRVAGRGDAQRNGRGPQLNARDPEAVSRSYAGVYRLAAEAGR